MNAVVVEVVPERGRVSLAQVEGRRGLGRVGEPHHLVEPVGAVPVGDVAEYAARADRGELLVVADEPDGGAPGEAVADHPVEGEGVGHARFVDHDQGLCADAGAPALEPAGGDLVVELGQRLA